MPMPLSPLELLYAYSQGIFPMAHEDGIYWYDPDPRAILPLDSFHVPRSLQRVLKKRLFEIRVNTAFAGVMRACAAPRPGREETWISDEFIDAYSQLHQMGYAHSVEAWQDGQLVGGLYGVAINSFFAGESMFSHQRDASKVALVALVRRLQARRFLLLDVQFTTPHLVRFGAVEISRAAYHARLAQALQHKNRFTND
ncbi:MAG: leucyl/phenylalanyl-tRNA--protein transferase [Ardenticatenaceae bacterium]|nr:leucyl/phenylalanyl-tRNA--protein transferase [Ardenticatenaceae bacterium]